MNPRATYRDAAFLAGMVIRFTGLLSTLLLPSLLAAQGDQQLRAKADALFNERRFAEAMTMYSQLVSLAPADRELNYRFGTCLLHSGDDKEKAIGFLKYATADPAGPSAAWYWLGRAYHLNYRFKEAQQAYQRFRGTGDKKALEEWPVEGFEQQCRNGEKLLSSLKDVRVRSKVESAESDFFRYYDLGDIGGRIVVTPEELRTNLDRKSGHRGLVYLPDRKGPIHFSSLGKDGRTGRDIYRTELMPDGSFATPVKLAGYINTDLDEDYPFLHPDGRTFYFCSKGHNSMGGYDVFRAIYDPGLNAFGRPENLDFAVNTPDDDVFYVVDGEHKEACFASGRSSAQGRLHVYRISTAQIPVVITVLKGTFANQLDKTDRRARIVVEDAITRETIADVRTDINGGYVLSLPRGGSFRFMVEAGSQGRTHAGMVEVPGSTQPRAYRQEIDLVDAAGQERLEIRNHFDEPLGDDMVALALDEIKRRALLEVSTGSDPAPTPAEPTPVTDVLTAAGFTGDVDKQEAQRIADDDAKAIAQEAVDLDRSAREALAMAVYAAEEADEATRRAEELVRQAADAADESVRNARMTEAATNRQRAREASLRARAAQRTAEDLAADALTRSQRAAEAARIATNVRATLGAGKDQEALPHLVALRAQQADRTGPNADPGAAERARRAVIAQREQADRALRQATGLRQEENELTDRVNRLKREQQDTGSKSRKAELQRSIDELGEQLAALRDETRTAQARAVTLERESSLLRGQAALTAMLAVPSDRPPQEVPADAAASLAQRILETERRAEALPIEERFEVVLNEPPGEMEARIFNWEPNGNSHSVPLEPSTASVADKADGDRRPEPTDPTARGDGGAAQANAATTRNDVSNTDDTVPVSPVVPANDASVRGESGELPTDGETPTADRPDTLEVAAGATADRPETGDTTVNARERSDEPMSADEPGIASGQDAPANAAAASAAGEGGADEVTEEGEDRRFLLENERAELVQALPSTRDRTGRTRIEQRIAAIDAELEALAEQEARAAQEAAVEAPPEPPIDPDRTPLAFTPDTPDDRIVDSLYADHRSQRERLYRLTDADERAEALHGLELMIADSIREEIAVQLAALDRDPQRALEVLPRVERLRLLQTASREQAERHLTERIEGIATADQRGNADSGTTTTAPSGVPLRAAPAPAPVRDRFVAIEPARVLHSRIEHRSPEVREAVAEKERDLARIDVLEQRIDSLIERIRDIPGGRERLRLEKMRDTLIDDRLILSSELGQRTAFLTRSEWRVADDSLRNIIRAVSVRGLPVNEPLLVMAQGMRANADRDYREAAELRRRADRAEDIVLRDTLYRQAYQLELQALRNMDRAITVQNYLAGVRHVRGEVLAYEDVAARVLGIGPDAGPGTAAPPEAQAGTAPPGVETTGASDTLALRDGGVGANAVSPDEEPVATGRVVDMQEQAPVADRMEDQRDVVAPVETVIPPATERAPLIDGDAEIQRAEAQLQPGDLVPAERYQAFLREVPPGQWSVPSEVPVDIASLDAQIQQLGREAAGLLQQADQQAAQARSTAEAATQARRRERERLGVLAVRQQRSADSLRAEAMLRTAQVERLTGERAEAAGQEEQRQRVMKFYYLSPDDQRIVFLNSDESRYFQMRALAMEQAEAASEADRAAKSNRDAAQLMRSSAQDARRRAGNEPDMATLDQVSRLETRAGLLLQRADSLDRMAVELRSASALNMKEAAALLQAMEGARSSELQALERDRRRNDAVLADIRQPVLPPAAVPVTPATGQAVAGGTEVPQPVATTPGRSADAVTPTPTSDRPATVTAAADAPASGADPLLRPERMPDELVSDLFVMQPAGAVRTVPIPLDAPMPGGIVFKVQIGAFRKPVAMEVFSDIDPVMGETLDNGLVRYTAGLFTGFRQAAEARDKVRGRGYADAFVVAYRDGRRITLAEAMRAVAEPPVRSAAGAAATTAANAATSAPDTTTTVPAGGNVPQPPPTAPVEVAPPVAAPVIDDAAILARYPATTEQVLDAFAPPADAVAYYNVPGAAPATQVETVRGLFYTVQVGVYSRPVPLDKLFNIAPLNSERTETAKVRYTTGIFTDIDSARLRRDEAVALGVKDAFITAYLNGRRIPMREAALLLLNYGPGILATP